METTKPPHPPDIADLEIETQLDLAVQRLNAGQVVGMPTETVYGLAARIDSEQGLRRIFQIKARPFFDPLIVHVASFKQAQGLVQEWPPLADFLARMFWPGALTLILKKNSVVSSLISSGLETVAIRYPSHDIALELIRRCDCPLAAPSANRFGHTSPSTAEHVRSEFPDIDLLTLDGGPCAIGVESTVLDVETETANEINILRPGGVSEEMLREALAKFSHPVMIKRRESAASPGHLRHHYMPDIPLIITGDMTVAHLRTEVASKVSLEAARNIAELRLDSDPTLAARQLYAEMRRLSESGASAIFIRNSGDRSGLWSAIWDRIERAATLAL